MSIVAQTVVSGSVANRGGEALTGSTVFFIQADTIAGGVATDSKGKFQIKGLPAGDYECRVSMLGYKPASKKFTLTDKTKLPQFILEEDAKALDEVVVSVDARKLTKELAGMSIYYLTDKAKKKHSIYDALVEIPRLIVNPLNRTIALDDLRSPLILVNGVKKSINTIDPKTIESVEIIDNPSARYRSEADVSAVLNIKIKKDGIKPYLTAYAGVIMTVDANDLFSWGAVETGTEDSSFNIDAGYSQVDETKSDSYFDILQGTLHRMESGKSKGYTNNWHVKVGGDKDFSKKNYIAYSAEYAPSLSINRTVGHGTVFDSAIDQESALESKYYNRSPFKNLTGSVYYKHLFTENRVLELEGRYGYSKNSSDGWREENSDIYTYASDINLYNTRHSGGLDVNYSDMLTSRLHFDVGAHTNISSTAIDDLLDNFPVFRYRRTQEYVYAGIDNNRSESRFNYILSVGADMVFNDADRVKHSYIDILPSASLSYKISGRQNVSLSYNRSRYLPTTNYLNPRNISTDSLNVRVGNPALTPSINDNFRLGYILSAGNLRLNPYIQYTYKSDLIQPYGYLDNDIYVSTYRNFGHGSVFQTGFSFNYRMPCGYVALTSFFAKDYLKGMPFTGNRFDVQIYGAAEYRKFSVSWNFGLIPPRTYSLYTKRIVSGPYSRIHFTWDPIKSVTLTFTAQNFLWPKMHSKTWTINGDYHAFSSMVNRYNTPKIAFGVWYTFETKNFKWRNKKSFNNGDRELENLKVN
ncbi:MAG: outer membrane beta-barrel protein [Muribaculaceae bacterium]|nr:outer membrane beta-barrel protein [Muribaculaceae bacterium]